MIFEEVYLEFKIEVNTHSNEAGTHYEVWQDEENPSAKPEVMNGTKNMPKLIINLSTRTMETAVKTTCDTEMRMLEIKGSMEVPASWKQTSLWMLERMEDETLKIVTA